MEEVNESQKTNRKLTIKLIISILLFLLAIACLCLGIWASQAGNDRFRGDMNVTTSDIDASITAQVKGTKTVEGEGFATPRLIWDSFNSTDEIALATWKDIDFTFADKNSIVELNITVANRKVTTGINALFTARLGDTMLDGTEKVIGETNIIAYVVEQAYIPQASSPTEATIVTYQVFMKVADKNKSIKPIELDVGLVLTDAGEIA